MDLPLAMDASTETSPAAGQEMVTIAATSSMSSSEQEQAPDYFAGRGPPMRRYVDFLSRCEVIATPLTADGLLSCLCVS